MFIIIFSYYEYDEIDKAKSYQNVIDIQNDFLNELISVLDCVNFNIMLNKTDRQLRENFFHQVSVLIQLFMVSSYVVATMQ